jgi:acyl-CoA dehydrogenase
VRDWREAHRRGAITDAQAAQFEEAETIVSQVLQVDDFAPEDLSPPAALAGAADEGGGASAGDA